MKRIFVALATVAALTAAPAFAQQAATAAGKQAVDARTAADVKALLEQMGLRDMLAASYAEADKMMPDMVRSQFAAVIDLDTSLSAEEKKEAAANLEKALPGLVNAFAGVFKDPALMDEIVAAMVPVYAASFTRDEIKQMAAFYRTPLGRKMLEKSPKLSADLQVVSNRIITPRMAKMTQDLLRGLQQK